MYLVNTPALQYRSSKPKGIIHDLKTALETHGLIGAIYYKLAAHWLIDKRCVLTNSLASKLLTAFTIHLLLMLSI